MAFRRPGDLERILVVRYADGHDEYINAKVDALEVFSPLALALRLQRKKRLPEGRILASIAAR